MADNSIYHSIFGFDWMPEQASSWAPKVDFINNFITDVSVFCTIAITVAMLYFAIRYRRRGPNDYTPNITHNATLETVWTVIPTVICIFVFYYGFAVYHQMRNPPANPLEIQVSGYQWAWEMTYPNGKKSVNELVVPINKPVRLITKSRDVNHSFFIPAMRVKEDVIGNTYHYLWFEPTKLGDFHIFCAEYCGTAHSGMIGNLKVVSQAEYDDYISDRKSADAPQLPPEEIGKLAYAKVGCNACHSIDGSKIVGPSFKGLWGREEEFEDGSKLIADENYIRESILHPSAKIVKGYPAVMQPMLSEKDEEKIAGIIAFIKTLK
jgi:cytochrome c oxidase subunit 2